MTQRDAAVLVNTLPADIVGRNGDQNRTQRREKPAETPSPTPASNRGGGYPVVRDVSVTVGLVWSGRSAKGFGNNTS